HGTCVPLPEYPWQRERFWLDGSAAAPGFEASAPQSSSFEFGRRIEIADDPSKEIWISQCDRRVCEPWFQHQLFGRSILPASAVERGALMRGGAGGAASRRVGGVRLAEHAGSRRRSL